MNKLVSDLISDLETIAKDIVDGIKESASPTKEDPTAPEAPETEGVDACGDCPFDEEEFEFLFVGEAINPAWEAVEALREAEVAADDYNFEKSSAYIAIADRYIALADIFKSTEVTVSI